MKNFDSLFADLSEKAAQRPAGSGTVTALDKGEHHIGKKIIEEAGEVWIAAEYQSDACLLYTSDAADDLLCVDLGGRRIIK